LKLCVISGCEALMAFQKSGWRVARRKGSHVTMIRENSKAILTVPLHRELDRGTMRSLIRKSGLTPNEFLKQLR